VSQSQPTYNRCMVVKKIPCSISIDEALLAEVDKYAESLSENRSIVIQRFIREGLKRAQRATKSA
jgi:metal-responsive CopG/Arc/MetJ family transcriptional regulator